MDFIHLSQKHFHINCEYFLLLFLVEKTLYVVYNVLMLLIFCHIFISMYVVGELWMLWV